MKLELLKAPIANSDFEFVRHSIVIRVSGFGFGRGGGRFTASERLLQYRLTFFPEVQ